jgi:hypothetical protein
LIRARVARVRVERVVLVVPLHPGPVRTSDDRKAACRTRGGVRSIYEPGGQAAAGAFAARRSVDIEKIERSMIRSADEGRCAGNGLLYRQVRILRWARRRQPAVRCGVRPAGTAAACGKRAAPRTAAISEDFLNIFSCILLITCWNTYLERTINARSKKSVRPRLGPTSSSECR